MKKVIFEQDYEGWESLQDFQRDLIECLDEAFNEKAKVIPDMFEGTISVQITYSDYNEKLDQ